MGREPGNKRGTRPEVSIKYPLHGGKDYSFGVARVVYCAWYVKRQSIACKTPPPRKNSKFRRHPVRDKDFMYYDL